MVFPGDGLELALDDSDLSLELLDLVARFGQQYQQRRRHLGPVLDGPQARSYEPGPCGMMMPSSRRIPRTVLMRRVRAVIHAERSRCKAVSVC